MRRHHSDATAFLTAKVAAAVILLSLLSLLSPARASEMDAASAAIKTHPGVVSVLQENDKNYWIEMETSGLDRVGFSQTVCGEMPKGVSLTIHILDTATQSLLSTRLRLGRDARLQARLFACDDRCLC